MKAAVAILARAPVPGRAKTRLTPPYTPEAAAHVARACLLETLHRFPRAIDVPFTLFLDGDPDPALIETIRAAGLGLIPQAEGDLGARLAAAFRALRAGSAESVVAIGADSPTLDPARIAEAIAALDECDVVLGPADDGGYYLVGARGDRGGIFDGIPWSTGRTLEVTVERARALGYAVRLLAPHYDIDDAATLARAEAEGFTFEA
ncbi:MAG TPA: TIGR04282 family arsenosugar biosynthesis glycosyltransferase [Candidatus Eisenbacteria bacterium]|nr:TIGR04282 family arsenosugar biosynthesis glycosyltransferase [Candidatus Eisenbacteria bacterium]